MQNEMSWVIKTIVGRSRDCVFNMEFLLLKRRARKFKDNASASSSLLWYSTQRNQNGKKYKPDSWRVIRSTWMQGSRFRRADLENPFGNQEADRKSS